MAHALRHAPQDYGIVGCKWMAALNDRNRTSHAYEEAMAKAVAKAIVEDHVAIFHDLFHYLKQEYDG